MHTTGCQIGCGKQHTIEEANQEIALKFKEAEMKNNNLLSEIHILNKSIAEKDARLAVMQKALEIASRQFSHAKNGNYTDERCIDGCAMCTVQKILGGK